MMFHAWISLGFMDFFGFFGFLWVFGFICFFCFFCMGLIRNPKFWVGSENPTQKKHLVSNVAHEAVDCTGAGSQFVKIVK